MPYLRPKGYGNDDKPKLKGRWLPKKPALFIFMKKSLYVIAILFLAFLVIQGIIWFKKSDGDLKDWAYIRIGNRTFTREEIEAPIKEVPVSYECDDLWKTLPENIKYMVASSTYWISKDKEDLRGHCNWIKELIALKISEEERNNEKKECKGYLTSDMKLSDFPLKCLEYWQ